MMRKSRTRFGTPEDCSPLKQKNDRLVKELVECRTTQRQLQNDLSYMVKEKLVADQKIIKFKQIFSHLNDQTKFCFKKIVECSTEITAALELLNSVEKIEDPFKTTSSITGETLRHSEIPDPDNVTQESNNDTHLRENEPEKHLKITKSNGTHFMSRGGTISIVDNNCGTLESDMELDMEESYDEEVQNSKTSSKALSVIYEDFEEPSSSPKEPKETNCLLPETFNSISSFDTNSQNVTEINFRRGEHYHECREDNLSTNVETSGLLDISTNGDERDNAVTPKRPPNVVILENATIVKSKREEFVKRKSIGSPIPSLEMRTSITPKVLSSRKLLDIESLDNNGSRRRKSSLPKRISSIDSAVSRRLKKVKMNSPLPSPPDMNSPLPPPPETDSLLSSPSKKNSPLPSLSKENSSLQISSKENSTLHLSPKEYSFPQLPEKAARRILKRKPIGASSLDKTIQAYDSSSMDNLIKITSTPIARENITSVSSSVQENAQSTRDKKTGFSSKSSRSHPSIDEQTNSTNSSQASIYSSIENSSIHPRKRKHPSARSAQELSQGGRRGSSGAKEESKPQRNAMTNKRLFSLSDGREMLRLKRGSALCFQQSESFALQTDKKSKNVSKKHTKYKSDAVDQQNSSTAPHTDNSPRRCSERKKCPNRSFMQLYVDDIQREERIAQEKRASREDHTSELSGKKLRRAVKPVVYTEPNRTKKLRRS